MNWKTIIAWFEEEKVRAILGTPRLYPHGSVLLRAEQQCNGLYVIVEGGLQAQMTHGGNLELQGPTSVAELGFLGQIPATATVVCTSEVKAYFIDSERLRALAEIDSNKTVNLMLELSKIAIDRWSGRYHDRYIALVAHDNKKSELIDFVKRHRAFFERHNLIATRTTGQRMSAELGINIARTTLSGPMGGDQEIGGLVSNGLIESVFFFRDPAWSAPHLSDVNALVRICEVHNVPIATNLATAELMVAFSRE
jgi:methylglyoxal synthase